MFKSKVNNRQLYQQTESTVQVMNEHHKYHLQPIHSLINQQLQTNFCQMFNF